MQASSEETPLKVEEKSRIKLDGYRWVNLSIFTAYCTINFFLTFQFTIIADITERYYNVNSIICDSSGLVFMIVYIIFFIPIGRFIEKHELRSISIISTGLTAFGNLLKFHALKPDRFYMIFISQSICGIGQVFMMGLPPKVASVWFGSEEVSLACGIGVMGCQLGIAIGSALPIFLVPDALNPKEIAHGFYKLFVFDNVASMLIFIIVVLFFRSKPLLPPSLSQAAIREGNRNIECFKCENLKKYSMNKDILLVLYCFGTVLGSWNCIGITMNEMFVHYFPSVGNTLLGAILIASILLGGVLGSIIFGFILDKTHAFKKLSLSLLILNCSSWSIFIFFTQERSLIGACSFFLIVGFSAGSLAVTAFEYSTEIMYPLPEVFGTTLLSVSIYFFSIIYTLLSEYIFVNVGYFTGQVVISIALRTAIFGCIFISSNFKRRLANLSDPENLNDQ